MIENSLKMLRTNDFKTIIVNASKLSINHESRIKHYSYIQVWKKEVPSYFFQEASGKCVLPKQESKWSKRKTLDSGNRGYNKE